MVHIMRLLVVVTMFFTFVIRAAPVHSDSGGEPVSGIPEIHGSPRWVGCNGFIMFLELSQKYLILNEKQIIVGKFKMGNRALTTRLENAEGENVGLEHFRVGQWVTIRGYEVSPTKIYASSVHAVKGYLAKDMRKIDKYEKRRPR
ncbi:MAG: hypothetical protein P8X96_10645 [Desulfobacteraceae bacterium]